MAKIEDYVDASGKPKTPEPAKAEEAVEQAEVPHTEEAPQPDDIPEKYQGKSVQELVQMHQEVERLAGRKGQEAGQLQGRLDDLQRTVDTLILQGQQPKEPEEKVDFFDDPETAVKKTVESNPAIKELRDELAKTRAEAQVSQLEAKHPDAAQIAQSQEFLEWVQAESGRRVLLEAAQAGNPAAADAVLSDYKKSQKPKQDNRKTEAKRAQTGATTASTASPSRKIYNSYEIRELMKKDPHKYQAWLKQDGKRAYAEGRVR